MDWIQIIIDYITGKIWHFQIIYWIVFAPILILVLIIYFIKERKRHRLHKMLWKGEGNREEIIKELMKD